ncbi:hypothetical protein H8S37_12560 [Mediterraneibacter sp. NSJ-55]|uniref:Uncharacterized protein n=1 Tax=Mediterraneibacter hominis TaxID=2763054 RepID=A0A923LK64_9FIRM|nr:hypothetical protein [Mediterraneibacter hominis]MBC5689749.1 hypothetical protein [Mediterraneibacter hominis]
MAQITVVYKDFEEMVTMAEELLKTVGRREAEATENRMPYGREIAPHFPEANTGAQNSASGQTAASAPVAQQPAQPVQTSAPAYTLDDLSRAGMSLMDKGMQGQLQQLIQSYGVMSLVELPPEQYGNFATALRGMGAQI